MQNCETLEKPFFIDETQNLYTRSLYA